jgi:DNA primase
MALSMTNFPPAFLDEIRSRLPVSRVVGARVQLRRQGRELVGLSPFKTEKTPSFTVNDQKRFYHCFATGEHGDIFKFIMEMEGLRFPEAVARLAEMAGVPMPEVSPEEKRRDDDHKRLLAVVEAATTYFERQLEGDAGREARSLLANRGVTTELQRRFRLGWSPRGTDHLALHLKAGGFQVGDMVTAGVLIGGSDVPHPYDRFRGRVMIPITDPRNRPIAFSARTIEPGGQPKYINSPETPLFRKGATLFNMHAARPAAHDHHDLIVV